MNTDVIIIIIIHLSTVNHRTNPQELLTVVHIQVKKLCSLDFEGVTVSFEIWSSGVFVQLFDFQQQ